MNNGLSEIYKGNNQDIEFIIQDNANDGTIAANYIDYNIVMTMKKNQSDIDADAIVQKTSTFATVDAATVSATISLTKEEMNVPTGVYYYDYTIISPDGIRETTLEATELKIKPKVKD